MGSDKSPTVEANQHGSVLLLQQLQEFLRHQIRASEHLRIAELLVRRGREEPLLSCLGHLCL